MRILYFSRDYTPHDHRFLTSLVESGQEVFFLRLERRGLQVEDRSLPPAVNQVVWRGGRKPFRWRDVPALLASLRGVIRKVRPDVLHAGPIQTTGFLAALSGFRPLVVMSWGSDLLKDADKNRWMRWVTGYTLRRSTTFTGDCAAVRDKALTFGVPQERIFTFPWGINLETFSPGPADGLRARLGWQDQFTVLSLRSWEPIYGIDVLLRGFARAAQQNPNLRLLLLGGGSLAGMVHQMIQQHNLEHRVHLGGLVNQNELPRIYRSADLYVSASHSDGSSVSLMEALGSGLPSLVTGIPSNREWVREGQEGWLFSDGDDAALAEKILHAASLPKERLSVMGLQARARAEDRADWKKNFIVLLEAYRAAIKLAGD
jgi:L-malate glycosyltransferase